MEATLLDKPIKSALISMAAPAAFGMLITFLFQLVDTYFVGQLGTRELAAISFAYPVYILIVSFFMGTAAGVSSTVGKALGQKNQQKAQSLTTLSISIFLGLTVLISFVSIATIEPIFSALGADPLSIAMISDYMLPLYLGMFALVGTLIGNSALMAKGIMVKTTAIMGIGGIINVVFDYLLIFGIGPFPALELQGAAIATVISWVSILVLMLSLLVKEELFSFKAIKSIKETTAQFKEVLHIATPAIAAQILNPIAIAVITRVVSQYGDNAIAAYGIAARIESLILTGILALSVIITPLVAQNYGAQAFKRLDQIIAYSARMTVYWGLAIFTVMALFSKPILQIFTDNESIIEYGQLYFYLVGLSFPAFGLALITTSFFNGVQKPTLSLKLTLIKSLGLTIPLALAGSFISIHFIWLGLALANITGAVYAKKLLNSWLKENDSELLSSSPIKDYIRDIKRLYPSDLKMQNSE